MKLLSALRPVRLAALLCLAPLALAAQGPAPEARTFTPADFAALDTLLTNAVRRQDVPGMVILVQQHGKTLFRKAAGVRNTETREALRPDDIFRIASQTKAITCTAILLLAQDGKLSLDDPLVRYLPEFAFTQVLDTYNPRDTTWTTRRLNRPITLRDLLSHSSGVGYPAIGTDTMRAIYAKLRLHPGLSIDTVTLRPYLRQFAKAPLFYQPGQRWAYSMGMDILGGVVEVASGMPFGQFVQQRIFRPLKMTQSWFAVPPALAGRLVELHERENGAFQPVRHGFFNSAPEYPLLGGYLESGGAGLMGTIDDYARFMLLFTEAGRVGGTRVLLPETVQTALAPGWTGAKPNCYQSPVFWVQATDGKPTWFSWGGAFKTEYLGHVPSGVTVLVYVNVLQQGDVPAVQNALRIVRAVVQPSN